MEFAVFLKWRRGDDWAQRGDLYRASWFSDYEDPNNWYNLLWDSAERPELVQRRLEERPLRRAGAPGRPASSTRPEAGGALRPGRSDHGPGVPAHPDLPLRRSRRWSSHTSRATSPRACSALTPLRTMSISAALARAWMPALRLIRARRRMYPRSGSRSPRSRSSCDAAGGRPVRAFERRGRAEASGVSRYLLRRVLILLPVWLAVYTLTFTLYHLTPGRPVGPREAGPARRRWSSSTASTGWIGRSGSSTSTTSWASSPASTSGRPTRTSRAASATSSSTCSRSRRGSALLAMLLAVGLGIPLGVLSAVRHSSHRRPRLDAGGGARRVGAVVRDRADADLGVRAEPGLAAARRHRQLAPLPAAGHHAQPLPAGAAGPRHPRGDAGGARDRLRPDRPLEGPARVAGACAATPCATR